MGKKILMFLAFFLSLGSAMLIPPVYSLKWDIWFYYPYHPDKSRFFKMTGPKNNPEWVPLSKISPACTNTLLMSEDQTFYSHHGVDLKSTWVAYQKNQKAHFFKFGGSTITQQLVKNIFLSRKKSYVRKIREIIGALLLDRIMSKDEQLEWYMNIIEYGPDVYGVKNGTQYYFQISPEQMDVEQCGFLFKQIKRPLRQQNQSEWPAEV